jgi:LysR family transcriptional regulator, transcription activator of glutamate synthase operon
MDLRQLTYVEAVARHRHFTRAAEELHVAQSAVSHQVGRLEAELGTKLFDRTTRSVELTEAGEVVVSRARRVSAEVQDLRGEVDELRGLTRGQVSVGALPPAGNVDTPALLTAFKARFPGIEVHLRGGIVVEFVRYLGAGELDAAFCLQPASDGLENGFPPGIAAERLGEDTLVASLPPRHELTRSKHLGVRDFAGLPLISPGPGSALRAAADAYLRDASYRPRFSLDSNDPFLIRCLVSQGFGVALLPRGFASLPGPRIEVRPLRRATRLAVLMIWREERQLSPALTAFIDFVRAEVGGATARGA